MKNGNGKVLTRRERDVLETLFRLRTATVSDIVDNIGYDISYAAVRAALKTLRDKRQVRFRQHGPRYVYSPTTPRDQARTRAVQHLVRTFFDGSPEAAAVAILAAGDLELDDERVTRLEKAIVAAREAGR